MSRARPEQMTKRQISMRDYVFLHHRYPLHDALAVGLILTSALKISLALCSTVPFDYQDGKDAACDREARTLLYSCPSW